MGGTVVELCYELIIIIFMIKRVTISVESSLVDELRSLAKKEGVSLSKLIAKSLEELLVEKKKREAGRKLLNVKLNEDEAKMALKELSRIREEDRWQNPKL